MSMHSAAAEFPHAVPSFAFAPDATLDAALLAALRRVMFECRQKYLTERKVSFEMPIEELARLAQEVRGYMGDLARSLVLSWQGQKLPGLVVDCLETVAEQKGLSFAQLEEAGKRAFAQWLREDGVELMCHSREGSLRSH